MSDRWKILAAAPLFGIALAVQAADIDLKMTTTTGGTKVSFQDSTAAEVASVNSKGVLTVSSNVVTSGYLEMTELSAVSDPAANAMRLYAKDVGGVTYMAYRDSTGAERLIRPDAFITLSEFESTSTNFGTTFKDPHWTLDTSKLSANIVDFTGYREARVSFSADNNEADTIECRAYNVTDATQIATAITDATGNPAVVAGTWTSISLTGDKTVRAECREGTGATADPDIGTIVLQLR